MKPHQERVIKEKSELDEKRQALAKFMLNYEVWDGLPDPEKVRLKYQLRVMDLYSEILRDRIINFE